MQFMNCKFLTALPVFNEMKTVGPVLDEVVRHCQQTLVVDDGSTDGTSAALRQRDDIRLVTHPQNRGYGSALMTAFEYAIDHDFDVLVTIDCDGQHEPQRIQQFVATSLESGADIVSGSRYLKSFDTDTRPPALRKKINEEITRVLNARLSYQLTDAFCGFKAYRVDAIRSLDLQETGYAMPLELWVQADYAGLSVVEVAVPLIYLDESRSFGGNLDQPEARLEYYYRVLDAAFRRLPSNCNGLNAERAG
jgi:dolichol-phosphate mannosyltransferase